MRNLLILPLACFSLVAAAGDVYRWVDSSGVVHYTDKPQTPTDKPAALPHLQTYTPSAPPAGFAPAQGGAGAQAPAALISIASPAPDETIRDAEGNLSVTVDADLQPGQGLIFYLDGSAANEQPTPSTAFLYTGVERGEHTVSAALVGGNGEELARSEPVTIHMKPPAARR